jgi:N-acetylglucosamine-6-phosphate deacetylase
LAKIPTPQQESRMSSRLQQVQLVVPGGTVHRELAIDDHGRIAALPAPGTPLAPGEQPLDGRGAIAFPGLIDVLTHGFDVHLYGDAEPTAIAANSRALPRCGVTAFAPSVVSQSVEKLLDILGRLAQSIAEPGARVLGLHSEGPCIASPGAHKADSLLQPSARLAEQMVAAARGRLAFTTLAPELPGAAAFCRVLREAGVGLHVGHSRATPADVPGFAALGISGVTHMYDVMFPATPTEPGVYPLSFADALLAEPALCLGLICDGVHAHPRQVQLLAQLPAERLFLETDSMKFTGLPSGQFELYPGMVVTTSATQAARTADGGLAGSCLTADQGLRNLLAFTGMPLHRAACATSLNPARLAGRERDLGSLEVGKCADFVLLAPGDLTVLATYVGGRCVYQR